MSAAHTPGPWTQDYFTASNGDKVHGVKSPSMSIAVAWVHGCNEDDSEGNARLIAAAPDLLAAIHAILFQVIQGKVLERDACITQARAAYAKATGSAA